MIGTQYHNECHWYAYARSQVKRARFRPRPSSFKRCLDKVIKSDGSTATAAAVAAAAGRSRVCYHSRALFLRGLDER